MSASKITLTFNKAMSSPIGKESEFSCEANSVSLTIDSITQPTTTAYQVNIVETLTETDSITCDYTKGTVTSADGGMLESFSESVVNNVITPISVGRLYHCDLSSKLIYELDPDTRLSISSSSSPSTSPKGIGGIKDRLYHCDSNADLIYELDPDTKLSISSSSSFSPSPSGIGGTKDRLYMDEYMWDLIYELDPDTLIYITQEDKGGLPAGIGGIDDRLYYCNQNTNSIYEIDADTKLDISSATSPSAEEAGIGGISNRLYFSSYYLSCELDPDTKLSISSSSPISSNARGIGGTK